MAVGSSADVSSEAVHSRPDNPVATRSDPRHRPAAPLGSGKDGADEHQLRRESRPKPTVPSTRRVTGESDLA
jgi:hypothetical protein